MNLSNNVNVKIESEEFEFRHQGESFLSEKQKVLKLLRNSCRRLHKISQNKIFICSACNKGFKDRNTWKKHLRVHEAKGVNIF
jgi:uncharacterized Zn-finger protein